MRPILIAMLLASALAYYTDRGTTASSWPATASAVTSAAASSHSPSSPSR